MGTTDARRRTPPPAGSGSRIADAAVAAFFGSLSRVRRRRIAHPHGVAFAARFEHAARDLGAAVFDRGHAGDIVVRLSRSIGLPESLADPCGIAIRFAGGAPAEEHQDLLLVTSGRARGARHLLLPARGFASRPYSSLLPFRVGSRSVVLGAKLVDLRSSSGPLSLAQLRLRETADLRIELTLASATGRWEPAGTLLLGDRLPAEFTEGLRFDPSNAGGGIEPTGMLNRLRPPAYRGSQNGRARANPAAAG